MNDGLMGTMRKLTRKLKKSDFDGADNFSLPTVDDARPIDMREQEELVRSFEKAEAQQSRLWKSVFSVLVSCYIGFLLYSIYQQATYPWELRYHAYFMEDLDSWLVIFADWVAVLACCMAIVGLLHGSKWHIQWTWCSCFIGFLLSVFWLYHMLRLPKFRWDVIWLPFCPLSAAGLCLYVDHLMHESSKEVQKLRSYMYAYKAS